MTDLVPYQPQAGWVEMLGPSAELAKQICDTEFVPQSLRRNPAAVAAAILYGHEIGIGPMMALAKISIIQGTPAPRAELARALILSHGHEFWVDEQTTTRCTVSGRRQGSDKVQTVTWTMDDAKKAGLGGNAWNKYPRQMLLARASAELARNVFADVLGGIAYFAEELDGEETDVPVNGRPATPEGTQKRSRPGTRSKAAHAPKEHGELSIPDDLPPLPDELLHHTEDAVELATDAQIKKLQTTYSEIGIHDADRKPTTCAILGLDILPSHKALTVTQASELIDRLTDINEGRLELKVDQDGRPTGLRNSLP